MYLRVPWWVMYLFSRLSFLKKRNDCAWQTRQVWTFNVASIMILVHTSTVVHSMIRSMRRPLLVLASIITWLGVVFWIRAIRAFLLQDICQSIDVSSFPPKKSSGLAPESLNSTLWVFSSRSLVPFGIAMRMRWWRRMAIQPREACCTPGHWEIWLLYRGSRNLFAVLVNFCWFCVPLFWEGRCLWLPCFQTNTCNHLQRNAIMYASDVTSPVNLRSRL